MSTRDHALVDFLSNGDDPEFGSAQHADLVRDGWKAADCVSGEHAAATWIPQRRYNVPVEALQRVWRGRRRGGVSE